MWQDSCDTFTRVRVETRTFGERWQQSQLAHTLAIDEQATKLHNGLKHFCHGCIIVCVSPSIYPFCEYLEVLFNIFRFYRTISPFKQFDFASQSPVIIKIHLQAFSLTGSQTLSTYDTCAWCQVKTFLPKPAFCMGLELLINTKCSVSIPLSSHWHSFPAQ